MCTGGGLPCFHAARSIILAKENVNNYVEKWFTVPEYRKTYENGICHLPLPWTLILSPHSMSATFQA